MIFVLLQFENGAIEFAVAGSTSRNQLSILSFGLFFLANTRHHLQYSPMNIGNDRANVLLVNDSMPANLA